MRPTNVKVIGKLSYNFVPKINTVSRKMDGKVEEDSRVKLARWERLYKMDIKYKEKLEGLREQAKIKQEEKENFSFKPQLIASMSVVKKSDYRTVEKSEDNSIRECQNTRTPFSQNQQNTFSSNRNGISSMKGQTYELHQLYADKTPNC